MDTKKLILYAALGVICFALWNAWQTDYPTSSLFAVFGAAPTAVKTTTQATTSSEVPAAVATAKDTGKPVVLAASTIAQNRIINVKTDVLDLAIDTLGGSVVSAKLLRYPETINQSASVQLFNDNPEKFYIAQSGLVNTKDEAVKQIQYSSAEKNYILAPGKDNLSVLLLAKDKGITYKKTFTFVRGNYAINVDNSIDNNSSQNWNGKFFASITRKDNQEQEGGRFRSTFRGAAISSEEKHYEKFSFDDLAKRNIDRDILGGWLAMQQHYFLSAWVPDRAKNYHYFSQVQAEKTYIVGLISNEINVPAKNTQNISSTLYVGPEVADKLKTIAPYLDLTIDYGWLWPISVALFWLMKHLNTFINNWGWTIIWVTLLIKAAFFKLSETSYRSMARMKELAPKLQTLKERYGDDRQKLNEATMELYRKEKINPLSFGGCLPMLIQIPVFIGLYYVLIAAVELRQAPFIFWIHDLSAKDPYYVLPILMGLSMLAQQLLNPQMTTDPMQAKMMTYVLPIVFTALFISFPSGLVLYWLVNNCVSALQQWYINKKFARTHHHKKTVTV